jgi:hypothetical protein
METGLRAAGFVLSVALYLLPIMPVGSTEASASSLRASVCPTEARRFTVAVSDRFKSTHPETPISADWRFPPGDGAESWQAPRSGPHPGILAFNEDIFRAPRRGKVRAFASPGRMALAAGVLGRVHGRPAVAGAAATHMRSGRSPDLSLIACRWPAVLLSLLTLVVHGPA